jgi:hypothetical protein
MLRMIRVSGSSLAVLIMAGAIASAANALPMFHLHSHVQQTQDTRIVVHVYNKGFMFRDLKVAGKTYTVLPHEEIEIKAPVGTEVYTESTSFDHRKGDLLFAVKPEMKDKTISIN